MESDFITITARGISEYISPQEEDENSLRETLFAVNKQRRLIGKIVDGMQIPNSIKALKKEISLIKSRRRTFDMPNFATKRLNLLEKELTNQESKLMRLGIKAMKMASSTLGAPKAITTTLKCSYKWLKFNKALPNPGKELTAKKCVNLAVAALDLSAVSMVGMHAMSGKDESPLLAVAATIQSITFTYKFLKGGHNLISNIAKQGISLETLTT